jgi:NACHT domain
MLISMSMTPLTLIATCIGVATGAIALGKQMLAWSERGESRRAFASYLCTLLSDVNSRIGWEDACCTEVEIEVTKTRSKRSLRHPLGEPDAWRARSLMEAVRNTHDRLVILEGEAGSGKTVALRHLAYNLAAKAASGRFNNRAQIGIYIDLKGLKRDLSSEPVGEALIRRYVTRVINNLDYVDLPDFLKEEMPMGLKNGTWLFLFDAFDELPDIVSAGDANEIVQKYADAIKAFLGAMGKSRAIVASRPFRGPRELTWSRFDLVEFNNAHQVDLVRRFLRKKASDLKAKEQAIRIEPERTTAKLMGELGTARPDIAELGRNPLFLSLLCERCANGAPFPENVFEVFDEYVRSRLTDRQVDLQARFQAHPDEIRFFAEETAFVMTANESVGFSAVRGWILRVLSEKQLAFGPRHELFDALEYVRLGAGRVAAGPAVVGTNDEQTFSFAHRRFQEFFATCAVKTNAGNVSLDDLMLDGRWRETFVTLLQTQRADTLEPILVRSIELLEDGLSAIPAGMEGPAPFPWPPRCLQLLRALQDGLSSRSDLALRVHDGATRILSMAWSCGTILDRKLAIEVSGIARPDVLLDLIRQSFSSDFELLRDAAYRQAGRLNVIPPDVARAIHMSLLRMAFNGRFARERYTVFAHLARLRDPEWFIRTGRRSLEAARIDLAISIAMLLPSALFLFKLWTETFGRSSEDLRTDKNSTPSEVFFVFLASIGGWLIWNLFFRSPDQFIDADYRKDLRWRCSVRTFLLSFVLIVVLEDIAERLFPGRPPISALYFLAAVYASVVYVSAMVSATVSAAARGQIPRSPWWVFLPLGIARWFSLPDQWRESRASLRNWLYCHVLRRWRLKILYFCCLLVIGSKILDQKVWKAGVSVSAFVTILHLIATGVSIPHWIVLFGVDTVAWAVLVACLYFLIWISNRVVTFCRALSRYLRWRKSSATYPHVVGGVDFLDLVLVQFRGSQFFGELFLHDILDRKALEVSPCTERMLAVLAAIAERSRATANASGTSDWLDSLAQSKPMLRIVSAAEKLCSREEPLPSFSLRCLKLLVSSRTIASYLASFRKARDGVNRITEKLAGDSSVLLTWLDGDESRTRRMWKTTHSWTVEEISLITKLREQIVAQLPELTYDQKRERVALAEKETGGALAAPTDL